jgi:nucleoside-diphosphate-sugar epimerase
MKIFITGHNGFLGQFICKALEPNHQLEFLLHDLRDHKRVSEQVLAFKPDIIVHLAARTEVEQSFDEQITFSDINYVGTVNLIETARKIPHLKNFVFASTMEVYGWQPISDQIRDGKHYEIYAFDETTSPNPNAPYAVAKLACERYLEYANRSYSLPYTIFRQTNAFGRPDNDFFVTERIISQMLTNSREIFLGDPVPYRNFIFIDDVVSAWLTVIENTDKVVGETFCIGPDNAVQISTWAQTIADKLNWRGKTHWYSRPRRPGEIYLLNSTNNKLTERTGWKPEVSLDEGLDRTIKMWQSKVNQTATQIINLPQTARVRTKN